MLTIKGMLRNGVIYPNEPIQGREGQIVVIMLPEETVLQQPSPDPSWDALMEFIDQSAIDMEIADLAHQHDYYIHGVPKRDPYP
jgi:hypothetical protein